MNRSPATTAARASTVLAVLLLGCCAASSALRTRTTTLPADAHTHTWEETFHLSADGARSQRVRTRTTIQTEFAIDELGDPRVTHNVASQKLEVIRDETTMRDGTKVAIAPNSINETTPRTLAATPAYADVRETVVTHVGLEVGCTNDFEYEIRSAASDSPLALVAPLHLSHTVASHVVRVVVPEDREVQWQCLSCDAEPSVTNDAGTRTLTFTWKALPSLPTGHGHTPAPGQPRLVVSTGDSWGLLADALLEEFRAAARPSDPIRERALAIAGELATVEQRMTALWRFVVEDIRTVHWPLTDLGFTPGTAAEVLDRSYGHSLDKAVLLSALLGSLDIPARPLLLSRDTLFARDVPALAQFSDVWLIVESDGSERWLSTTTMLPGDGMAYVNGRTGLDLEAGVPLDVVAGPDESAANHARLTAELDVAADGKVTAEMHITLTGSYSPYFAAVEKGSAAVAGQQVPSGWSVACDGCYARAHHLAPDLATFNLRAEKEAGGAGRVVEVDLPWVPGSQLMNADIHRLTKATDTPLRTLGMESVRLEVRAADGLKAESELPSIFLSNSVGNLVSNHETEAGAVVANTTLTVDKRVLTPEDYLSLRDLITELRRASSRSLLFKRTP